MKILVINPGSTSTKIAVYRDHTPLFVCSIRHEAEQLAVYTQITDQFDFRKALILQELQARNIPLDFHAIIGRGGLLKPIPSGVYVVNERMKHDVLTSERQHASNLGCLLASDMASSIPGCLALIADPVVVDELQDIARISGLPQLPRLSIFHALNQKAIARQYAREQGVPYEELRLIVCHLGGGISTGVHLNGRIVDVNNALDGEGPFAPERSGTLPAGQLVDLCYSGRYSKKEIEKMLAGQGGLYAHLNSTSIPDLIHSMEMGDQKVRLILEAMIYNVAKSIGAAATVLCGQVDAILLTGGMAYASFIVVNLRERVEFLAPVKVYPGEDEMNALAMNALAVLTGELPLKVYE
ncbi:MAG: butyrate kinase [Bacteroides sp.]|nr:butyrate kinase [Bacteroides sp.]